MQCGKNGWIIIGFAMAILFKFTKCFQTASHNTFPVVHVSNLHALYFMKHSQRMKPKQCMKNNEINVPVPQVQCNLANLRL